MEVLFWVLLSTTIVVGLLAGETTRLQRRNSARLAAIERRLALVMDHLSIVEPELPEVVRMLEQGKTLDAIAVYQQATGTGLREARDAVEAIAARRGLNRRS